MEMKKIHADERGDIYSIPLSDKKDIALLVTNKGFARGGHSHPNDDEYFIVVKGIVKFWVDDTHELFHEGMSECVPHGSRHFFVSLTDSIVMHWGADRETTIEDAKYRGLVDEINKLFVKLQTNVKEGEK